QLPELRVSFGGDAHDLFVPESLDRVEKDPRQSVTSREVTRAKVRLVDCFDDLCIAQPFSLAEVLPDRAVDLRDPPDERRMLRLVSLRLRSCRGSTFRSLLPLSLGGVRPAALPSRFLRFRV